MPEWGNLRLNPFFTWWLVLIRDMDGDGGVLSHESQSIFYMVISFNEAYIGYIGFTWDKSQSIFYMVISFNKNELFTFFSKSY